MADSFLSFFLFFFENCFVSSISLVFSPLCKILTGMTFLDVRMMLLFLRYQLRITKRLEAKLAHSVTFYLLLNHQL